MYSSVFLIFFLELQSLPTYSRIQNAELKQKMGSEYGSGVSDQTGVFWRERGLGER